MSASCGELLGIDGKAIEFEWNIFPGLTSLQILQKIQDDLRERNIEPEQFTDHGKKWCGKCKYKPEGKWNSVASQMIQRFKETGHPVFTSVEFLRMLKGKEAIHFNADAPNTELLFRIIRFDSAREGTRKNSRKRRMRDQRKSKEREFTRSELFWCLLQD